MFVRKHYVEFDVNITPKEVAGRIKNIYENDDRFVAKSKGSFYVFTRNKISAMSIITDEHPLDLKSIHTTVRSVTGNSSTGKSVCAVLGTKFPVRDSLIELDKIHSRLAQKPPSGIVLNIYEPSLNSRLVLKFSAFRDGFTATFHVESNGDCLVLCNTKHCNSTVETCNARCEHIWSQLKEYF